MLLFNENAISSGLGYTIEKSLRFRSGAYLNRTPASAGNRQIWTLSTWIKRGLLGGNRHILTSAGPNHTGGADINQIEFNGSDQFQVYDYPNSTAYLVTTSQVFRDPSAWYHIVVEFNSTNATASDRIKIYINGSRVTNFSNATYPSLNYSTSYINSTRAQVIGHEAARFRYPYDGYMAEFHFIDGQALTPSSFGSINPATGVWTAKEYTGTYGTNGFYLPFTDTSSTTTLVADSSGNGNNWTPNNISLTAGATYDSMLDSPTLGVAGTQPVGNYAVISPIDTTGSNTITEGNLKVTTAGSNINCRSTFGIPTTGKWYFEATDIVSGGNNIVGIANRNLPISTSPMQSQTGSISVSMADNAVFGFAFDFDALTYTIYKNNIVNSSGSITSGIEYAVFIGTSSSGGASTAFNFGQRPFAYTPPSGFKSLCTTNLPQPTIGTSPTNSPDDYFKTYLYRGNGGGLQVGEIQKPFTTYNVERSLRFRSSASAYLNRTLTTPTNNRIFTWSGWIKRGLLGGSISYPNLFGTASDEILFYSATYTDQIAVNMAAGGQCNVITSQVFRDPSAWYHIIIVVDTTQATAANRVKIYVNGVQVTIFSVATYPSQNYSPSFNSATSHSIGNNTTNRYFDGYMAEVNFIDGQALTPSSFGEFDGNNYWVPKTYSGSYGTNGFYLDFKDNGNIGNDASGSNDWTPNNFNVATPGITYDWMIDSPTLYDDDGNGRGNYATLNALTFAGSAALLTDGNIAYRDATGSATWKSRWATIAPTSGKWYAEMLLTYSGSASFTSQAFIGLHDGFTTTTYTGQSATSYGYISSGTKYNNGTSTAYGSSWGNNDIVQIAYDADLGKVWFGKNGTWQASGNPAEGTNEAFSGVPANLFIGVSVLWVSPDGITWLYPNFGQRPFSYTPPTGFKALNSYNIAEVTDDLEQPDFVWIKARNLSQNHALFDSVRGVQTLLKSNSTDADATDVNSLLQFNKNGFLLGSSAAVNTVNEPYVAWVWKAGLSTVTNTSGTISSQVRANPTSGFSIVTYTGTGANATVGHGLGVAPSFIVVKRRNSTGNWISYHSTLGVNQYIYLNSTTAATSFTGSWGTSITSTTFGITGSFTDSNANGGTYVSYCFSEINGYSKFGSYTGNGSADGPFIFCGFKPRFILMKNTNSTFNWFIFDTARGTFNTMNNAMMPNANSVEQINSIWSFDILSNGFKCRGTNGNINGSGLTYIFAAFAENPFKYSLAR